MIFKPNQTIEGPPLNGAYAISIQIACPEIQIAFVNMIMNDTFENEYCSVMKENTSLF